MKKAILLSLFTFIFIFLDIFIIKNYYISPSQINEDKVKIEKTSILNNPEEIDLREAYNENNYHFYHFTYSGKTFTAYYTTSLWHINDSYKITNKEDITIICQALIHTAPVCGSDLFTFRTAEDMAYEWLEHNRAYQKLPKNSKWMTHLKDVDLDPPDQNKSIVEIYLSRLKKEQKSVAS